MYCVVLVVSLYLSCSITACYLCVSPLSYCIVGVLQLHDLDLREHLVLGREGEHLLRKLAKAPFANGGSNQAEEPCLFFVGCSCTKRATAILQRPDKLGFHPHRKPTRPRGGSLNCRLLVVAARPQVAPHLADRSFIIGMNSLKRYLVGMNSFKQLPIKLQPVKVRVPIAI